MPVTKDEDNISMKINKKKKTLSQHKYSQKQVCKFKFLSCSLHFDAFIIGLNIKHYIKTSN